MSCFNVVKVYLCFYFVTSVLLQVSALSVKSYANSSLVRVARATKKCNGFMCETSQKCIKSEKKCDGRVDCEDGSDEFNDCKSIECPGYLFTCDYGACIEMDTVCDKKKDCRDNSDEVNCLDQSQKVSSNCNSKQFECTSGQCISLEKKCDGKPDCGDRSDETKGTCLNMNCPGFTFICDYGACVDGFAECNDVKDCIDNSDEDDVRCNRAPVTKPTVKPPVTSPPTTGGCVLPQYPEHGRWVIRGGAKAAAGTRVGYSTILTFECDFRYKLSSENNLIACIEGGWSTIPPTCLKLCPTLYTSETTMVKCLDHNRAEIKCDSATNGSTASFECANYYEPAERTALKRFCWEGVWNLQPPQCVPVCGEKFVTAVPLIVNGQEVERGSYPWVAAIYRKVKDGFQNSCGGSMLTQKVIVTAAHCVTYEDVGDVVPSEEVKIAVGKYYNEYKDPKDTQAQYSDITKILVHPKYRGLLQKFASDIAFLITKDQLLFSKVVQPVCYQNIPNIHLNNRMQGVITGWGYTESHGSPSNTLKEISIPFKDDATCLAELPKEWTDLYFTYDKMCAGHYNKSIAVCKGDSGGGLVFPQFGRYYIHGIVSVAQRNGIDGCNVELSSLYTKIAAHYDWLEEVTSRYK